MLNISHLFGRQRSLSSNMHITLVILFVLACMTLLLARVSTVKGSDEAVRKLNRFVQTSNSPSVKIFREGRDLIEAEAWGEAEKKFEGFIVNYPKDRDVDAALYWLAYALKKQGKFRAASQQLERLMSEFPKSSWRDEAEAMLTEIAPQLGDRRTIDAALSKDNDEIKIVALQSLFESNPERAMSYVAEILKPNSKASPNLKEAAVSLLGSYGGQQAIPLLLDVARNQTDTNLRQVAIHRLGDEGGEAVIDELMKLYATERNVEIKEQILHTLSDMNSPRAQAVLLEVARRSGDDIELRKTAIHRLGERKNSEAVSDLLKIYDAETNREIREQILHSLAESEDPRGQAKLLEIARGGDDIETRKQAIHWLGEKDNEATLDELMRIYDAEKNAEVRDELLRAFSEMHSPRARAKLVEIARNGDDPEVRQTAIRKLIEDDDAPTLEMLIRLYDAEQNPDVKEALLRAFGESKQKRALRKLMEVARGDSSVEMRKKAVHLLGESRDPEALKFLEDLLK